MKNAFVHHRGHRGRALLLLGALGVLCGETPAPTKKQVVQTPFGDSVWTRRRAELSAFEKEILAAQPAAARK